MRTALKVALAAGSVSITIMELLDKAFVLAVPGVMSAGLTSALSGRSFAGSLTLAFTLTTPVNRWMITRGRGHAVVHQYHSH